MCVDWPSSKSVIGTNVRDKRVNSPIEISKALQTRRFSVPECIYYSSQSCSRTTAIFSRCLPAESLTFGSRIEISGNKFYLVGLAVVFDFSNLSVGAPKTTTHVHSYLDNAYTRVV